MGLSQLKTKIQGAVKGPKTSSNSNLVNPQTRLWLGKSPSQVHKDQQNEKKAARDFKW